MSEYIEREALIAELAECTIISDDLYGMGIMAGIGASMKKVSGVPAADVAPVWHGRWNLTDSVWFARSARNTPYIQKKAFKLNPITAPTAGQKWI